MAPATAPSEQSEEVAERFGGKSAMNSLLQMMDRFKAVEGVILIIAVLIVPHTHGIAEYAALIIVAALLVVLYSWWRRKGLFANRR
jgi:O-antigen/teichoic acid export membrane protein